MTNPLRKLPALAGLAGALALAGAARAETHIVRIEGMQFVPASLTVRRGDQVVWRNLDVVPHTATARGAFDSRAIATGQRWTGVMGQPGRHDYGCDFHPGMKGTVVVK